MRYREGQAPSSEYPYTQGTHDALAFSMWLGIVVGIVLLWMGMRGRILWLIVWSIGLVILSIFYLINDWLHIIQLA